MQFKENFNIEEYKDQYFWRYMDLLTLIDLINSKSLHFTRLDKYEDALEGLTANGIHLKAFTRNSPYKIEDLNNDFDLKTKEKIIKQDLEMRSQLEIDKFFSKTTQFANCWYTGKKESYAMWKIYSNHTGVAIKINAEKLINKITTRAKQFDGKEFEIIYMGNVEYKNLVPFDHTETYEGRYSALKKDNSYSHENEFRFVVVTRTSYAEKFEYFKLELEDISDLEIQIIANPFMEKWKYDNLSSILSKYGYMDSLMKSHIELIL